MKSFKSLILLCYYDRSLFVYVTRYSDPRSIDQLAAVAAKVDVVKTVMQENIAKILENTTHLEKIDEKALQLNEQARGFRDGTKELKNKMWWKMWKMRLLIGGLVIAVLIIIIVPIAVTASSSKSK